MNKKETIKMSHAIKFCVLLCGAVVALALFSFHIEDKTWTRDEVGSYDTDWYVLENDQSKREITLPHSERVSAYQTFVIEKTLTEEACGMTIGFLTADVYLKVWVDGEQIYQFGYEDDRWFGRTPGSIMNFVDIPEGQAGKTIRMETVSPYDDYAGNIKSMMLGERDLCILQFLKKSAINIIICIFIFVGAIFLYVLYLVLGFSKLNTHSIEYLSFFATICGIYYMIETKILTIFYGNQTLYSILVFLLLMMMPIFLSQYYKNTLFSHIGKQLDILQKCIIVNCIVQILLQLLNVADFMEMAFLSHGIIGTNILLILYGFAKVPKKLRNNEYVYEVIGMTSFLIGSGIDLGRTLLGSTGDLGKYSRLGAMFFVMVMIIIHVRYMILDYTSSLKKKAEELQAEKEIAIQASKAKSTFLANMSHEIRTPINAVLGMDEMIIRESKEEQVLEYAFHIQSAGKALLALINDVLDFSKIESGNMELVNVEYQISSVIGDVVSMISEKIRKKGLTFDLAISEEVPNLLYGDEVRIRQIILNVVDNAVKYTDYGSVMLKLDYRELSSQECVEMNLTEKEEAKDKAWIMLIVQVQDTGKGIKSQELNQLFKSFKRLDSKKNCTVEGTGLGLSIVKSFVDMMQGEITVESIYGQGSTFTMHLPQKIVSREVLGKMPDSYEKNQGAVRYDKEGITAPKAKVLVVDDNLMNVKVVTKLLGSTKIQIDTALNGKEAIELVGRNQYHIIFLDHMMPEMDGIETLQILKEKKLVGTTPVIALTANAVSGAREQYMAKGFQDYLSKPVSGEQLEKKIVKWLAPELIERRSTKEQKDSKEQSIYEKLKEIPQLNVEKALNYSGDGKQGVVWNIELYLKQSGNNREKLEHFLEKKQLEDYTILVHAMKSNLALIGAEQISEMARNLEAAGKKSDLTYIQENHSILIAQLTQLEEKLNQIFGGKETGGKLTIETETQEKASWLTLVHQLKKATEDYDVVGMEEVKEQLQKLPKLSEFAKQAEELEQAIDELDFDEVNTRAEKLLNTLEGK